MRFAARAFTVVFILFLTLFFSLSPVFAQTNDVNPYNIPDTDPNVPANQHTRVQTLFIDIMASTMCILVGIDPVDTSKPCLDINPETGKIGYNPASFDANGNPKVGGLLGTTTSMISMLYTPTISSSQYTQYLAQNFGIVKPAYAQEFGYGFNGLYPLLALWTAIRNMAYFLLMVAFVIIGLGIMLRIEMQPRTIMTIQNQIPRIIICIILVTFSYGIAGLLIDTMWLTTYIGINAITSAGGTSTTGGSPTNPIIPGAKGNLWMDLEGTDPNREPRPLSDVATANLLQTPILYFNSVFRSVETTGQDPRDRNGDVDIGLKKVTQEVSYSLGQFFERLIQEMMGVDQESKCASWTGIDLGKCLTNVLGFIAKMLLWIIILITIMRTLFSVWFTLLKAYTYIVVYSIAAPFFIVMGLLPGKPLGFEKWLRSMVANLAVFPVTAFVFVLGRLFVELFNAPATAATAAAGDAAIAATQNLFIPPLVGNPNITGLIGWLIAFGLLLMTPTMLPILQESLKVTGTKHGAAIGAGLAAGAAAPKAAFGGMWNNATRQAKLHEHDAGWLRRVAAGKGADEGDPEFKWGNRKSYVPALKRLRYKLVKFHGFADGKKH